MMMNSTMTFQEFVYSCGLGHHDIIFDGQIHRIKPPGSNTKSSWYIAYQNFEFESGSIGDWKTGLKQNFCNINKSVLTAEQRKQHAQKMEKSLGKITLISTTDIKTPKRRLINYGVNCQLKNWIPIHT
jgi:phage/plasmid primase-like uncharacterized protein